MYLSSTFQYLTKCGTKEGKVKPLDILTIGEALVEVMRTDVDQPLHQAGPFIGPYPSGAPFIFAVQCARLGMKTGAIGAVGQDAFGQCLLGQLTSDGVVTDGVTELADETTGVAFVSYNSDGSRDFVFSLGAGGKLSTDMLKPVLFSGLRCFHIMGSTLSMSASARQVCKQALALAVQNGARISFDPNLRPELLPVDRAKIEFAPFLDAANIVIPTEEELLLLTNATSVEHAVDLLLAKKDDRIIAVTKGKDGCHIFTQRESFIVEGYVVSEVDPTGAGDCFDAGFISGLLRGYDLRYAAQLANACGANAVMVNGPMDGARNLDLIEDFIETH